ncbi:unnamed protein product [Caenorhabditis bovis]|uniref:7TM GPCR serpentine receptor class x (Srx) domain-containing protein n=1 Tax=Caenorhabditis bovis TaxID=2654633 RepID=A0A8S1EAY8_9PELO|nr:unnamed protein product [Caenorhabditis bovis]
MNQTGDTNIFEFNNDRFMIRVGLAYMFVSIWLLPLYALIMTVLGCIINTFWIAEFPAMTTLAVSRILIFCDIIQTKRIPIPIKIILFIAYSWIAFVLIYGCISQNFAFTPPSWGYDFDVEYAELFGILELALSFPCLAISYFSYIFIIYLIYSRKKHSQSKSNRRNELAIMIQYTFVTTYMVILIFLWHEGDVFLEMTDLTNAILNCFWIGCSYLNPVLLLILNKQIRNEIHYMLGGVRKMHVTQSVRTMISNN